MGTTGPMGIPDSCSLLVDTTRLVVGLLESGIKSIFAGLGLGLGHGKICNEVHFQFSLCPIATFCLGRMIFCQPVLYTQPKIYVNYLIFSAELTHRLACSDSTYIVSIFLLLVHTAVKDLDLDLKLVDLELTWTWLLLDLIQVWTHHSVL